MTKLQNNQRVRSEDIFYLLKQMGHRKPRNLLSSADGRSMIQDSIYLIQEVCKIDLGFKFRWYVK